MWKTQNPRPERRSAGQSLPDISFDAEAQPNAHFALRMRARMPQRPGLRSRGQCLAHQRLIGPREVTHLSSAHRAPLPGGQIQVPAFAAKPSSFAQFPQCLGGNHKLTRSRLWNSSGPPRRMAIDAPLPFAELQPAEPRDKPAAVFALARRTASQHKDGNRKENGEGEGWQAW
jgi:hypothetical protein